MNYRVYAIYSRKRNKVYIGQTRDIDICLELHRNKVFADSYTARFDGSWELIYVETVEDRERALLREKQLKSYRGRQFAKQFIPQ